MRRALRLLVLWAAVAAAVGCSRNPATGEAQFPVLVGPETEEWIGDETHRGVLRAYGGVYRRKPLNDMLQRVVTRLAPHVDLAEGAEFAWRAFLLDSPVVNAFALPGGRVYLTRGMAVRLNDEAEAAAVIGHEMGHVAARHTVARIGATAAAEIVHAAAVLAGIDPTVSRQAVTILMNFYGQSDEYEADLLGQRYAAAAGYEPRAAARVMRLLYRQRKYEERIGDADPFIPIYYMTHPPSENRAERLDKQAEGAPPGETGDQAAFMRAIDGVAWGDRPGSGHVQGRDFVHPGLGLGFTVPAGWRLSLDADRVTAENPRIGGLAIFDMAARRKPEGEGEPDAQAFLADLWKDAAPLKGLRKRNLAGYPSATGRGRIDTPYGPAELLAAVALDEVGGRVYRFACLRAGLEKPEDADDCRETLNSLRPVTRAALRRRTAERVAVTPALPGDTVESAAERLKRIPHAALLLRALNGLDENEQPRSGGWLKTIVAD